MASTLALDVFERLMGQVSDVQAVARSATQEGDPTAEILRRSAYVLAVAAIDSYFHELSIDRMSTVAKRSRSDSTRVSNYLGHVSASDLEGPNGEAYIRYRIGFKTLVAPDKVDKAIAAWGGDPDGLWKTFALRLGSRPDRERRQLELIYDRRNQIAHEGDWDSIQLDFRPMAEIHLEDCVSNLRSLAKGFDAVV